MTMSRDRRRNRIETTIRQLCASTLPDLIFVLSAAVCFETTRKSRCAELDNAAERKPQPAADTNVM